MFTTLHLERNDRIAILTLNSPEKRNAMTFELTREFPLAMEEVCKDTEVKVLVITNTGSVFCAGADLQMLEDHLDWTSELNRDFLLDFYRSYLSVVHTDVPTIAAISGHAIGAGLSFTLGCDIRIAAEGVRMGVTYINLGLYPGMATTYLLPLVVGTAHAADLILTCRLVEAREALAMGLVNRVVAPEKLMGEAMATAREIAAKPTSVVRMAKRALAQAKIRGLDAALDYEAAVQASCFGSPEMRELIGRFKRK